MGAFEYQMPVFIYFQTEEDMSNLAKVSAFLDSSASFTGFHGSKQHSSKEHGKKKVEFRVEEKQRDLFLSLFNITKYRTLGVGFPV